MGPRLFMLALIGALILLTQVPAAAQWMMPSGACYWGACRNWAYGGRYYSPRPYGYYSGYWNFRYRGHYGRGWGW